ncbi:hypothetical protein STEG23_035820 [Scotinomys teguina]
MLDGLKMEENFQSAIETSASLSSLLGRAVSPKSVCEGCQRVISDRFLLRLNDSFWHEQCVQCASCKEPLETTCFYRDKKLYCKYHYEKVSLNWELADLLIYMATKLLNTGLKSAESICRPLLLIEASHRFSPAPEAPVVCGPVDGSRLHRVEETAFEEHTQTTGKPQHLAIHFHPQTGVETLEAEYECANAGFPCCTRQEVMAMAALTSSHL